MHCGFTQKIGFVPVFGKFKVQSKFGCCSALCLSRTLKRCLNGLVVVAMFIYLRCPTVFLYLRLLGNDQNLIEISPRSVVTLDKLKTSLTHPISLYLLLKFCCKNRTLTSWRIILPQNFMFLVKFGCLAMNFDQNSQ